MHVSFVQNLGISLIFTLVSLGRQYVLRAAGSSAKPYRYRKIMPSAWHKIAHTSPAPIRGCP